MSNVQDEHAGPYLELSRADWAELAKARHLSLDPARLERLRGLGDPTDMSDVGDVYQPLCQLLALYYEHTGRLFDEANEFLGLRRKRTPFVIGIAGSVAVGKSTVARLLKELLQSDPRTPKVDLITTDGFLYPNAELVRRGIMERKGFPESYDCKSLLKFVIDVKSGCKRVVAPVYSHMVYDVVPDQHVIVEHPDILIIEGLNVLAPSRRRADGTASLAISDFFDFTIYVDADEADIRQWYTERFMTLRQTAFNDPQSFFKSFTDLTDDEAVSFSQQVWNDINGPNLALNVQPTRARATCILRKGHDHRVHGVRIRKI
ncbi:MAG: type I pantothenate kinase [Propionibacteriaceae bacterium]